MEPFAGSRHQTAEYADGPVHVPSRPEKFFTSRGSAAAPMVMAGPFLHGLFAGSCCDSFLVVPSVVPCCSLVPIVAAAVPPVTPPMGSSSSWQAFFGVVGREAS